MQTLTQRFDDYCAALEKEALQVYALSMESLEGEKLHRAWRSSDPTPLYSATKSITSMAVGFAREEGLLDLEDRVLDYFPEYADGAAPGSEKIRLKHLLTMSSGHRCFKFGAADKRAKHEDWVKLFFELPLREEPGTRFTYSNSDVYVGGRIVEKVSGQLLRDYLMPRLFLPLKIVNPLWGTCPLGHNNGASKLFLEPKEFAHLGHLLLHKGAYKGKQLLPRAYMEEAISRHIPTESIAAFKHMAEAEKDEMRQGYGYWIWRGANDAYRADGKYGQFLAVYPEAGFVLSLMAHVEDRPYRFLTLLEERL